MRVARDFKRKNPKADFSNEGYHCEVQADEFGLEDFAKDTVASNNLVYRFLAYICTKRVMESAVRDGVIPENELQEALKRFPREIEFESQVIMWQKEAMAAVAKVKNES